MIMISKTEARKPGRYSGLPFAWIEAVAVDILEKENLLQAALFRNDKRYWSKAN